MQRLLDFIFNVHKLWSKNWAVVFFNYKNMPLEGDKITVGELEAVFKKVEENEVYPKEWLQFEEPKLENFDSHTDITMPISPVVEFWECPKCHCAQKSEPIDEAGTAVLRCKECGFRQVKQ